MLFPACTGFGDATFVTERFGLPVPTSVVVDALLLAEFGSVADDETATESVMTVPLATPVFTFTIIVNVPDALPAMLVFVQITFPVLPAPGVRQLHPDGAEMETNVVLVGTAETYCALSAALGPLFVTTCVYVMFDPAATGSGLSVSVTDKSALEAGLAESIAVSFNGLMSPPPLTTTVLLIVAGADCDTFTLTVIAG